MTEAEVIEALPWALSFGAVVGVVLLFISAWGRP